MEQLKNILFIDIETVPLVPEFTMLPEGMQAAWAHKAKILKNLTDPLSEPAVLFGDRAGIYSEFGKVVCIGFGSLQQQPDGWRMRLKSLTNADEQVLLHDFCDVLKRFSQMYPDLRLCGHNIKEFDVPFLCRRMIINGIALPDCMQLQGKKPWEIGHIDTMELWRFGDYKNFTALSLLAEVLGIPSPKDDLDGSMVASVFWRDGDLPRIAEYCLKDVLTSARVYLKLRGIFDIEPEALFVSE